MADILIRMEMPKGCKSCKLSSDSHCNATGQWLFSTDLLRSGFNWKTCRLPDCPLVELPKHGDLIDRDALIKTCNEIIDEDWNAKAAPYSWSYAYESFVDDIEAIPVVIPSNKEETE